MIEIGNLITQDLLQLQKNVNAAVIKSKPKETDFTSNLIFK